MAARDNARMSLSREAARRSAYIAVMRRRLQPGSGSSVDFLKARRVVLVPGLTRLLAGHPFVVVGGVATSLYMPARHTDDVDILVTESAYPGVEAALVAANAERLGPLVLGGALGTRGVAWRLADGSELDVLVSGAPWARDAIAHPRYDAQHLPIIGFPYLVLMKLDAGRGVDVGDLGRMLGLAEDAALQETRSLVSAVLPGAREDLESLVELGRLELRPPSAPSGTSPGAA